MGIQGLGGLLHFLVRTRRRKPIWQRLYELDPSLRSQSQQLDNDLYRSASPKRPDFVPVIFWIAFNKQPRQLGSQRPSQVVVIVGSVLGVAAVAAAVAFLLYRVRRKRARSSIKNSTAEPPPTPSTGNTDSSSRGTKPPRNPHFAPLIQNPKSDEGVPSRRGPQGRISQQLWSQKGIPLQPHSPVPISASFHPFPIQYHTLHRRVRHRKDRWTPHGSRKVPTVLMKLSHPTRTRVLTRIRI